MSINPTVREWTYGWTRHVLVHNAISMLRPAIDGDKQPVSGNLGLNPALQAVMRLKNFERFVFVLSILEGYSDRECSQLLGPSARDIMAAKVRALENLATNLKCQLALEAVAS
jgi:DNA-directed RNA polymerase specialized sigma24 family protein